LLVVHLIVPSARRYGFGRGGRVRIVVDPAPKSPCHSGLLQAPDRRIDAIPAEIPSSSHFSWDETRSGGSSR
jgi:hypothetical protein